MNLAEMVSNTLDPSVAAKTKKVMNAFASELKRFDKKAKVEMEVVGPFHVKITSDLQHYMSPEDINNMWEDLTDAVSKADTEGHIFKMEEEGSGEYFVQGLLSGLRPGMKLNAEAFFPTVGFSIKWKQIVSSKKR
jgi:hypothetical protein